MNNIVRAVPPMPQVGDQQGNWVWDGQQWVCGPCDDGSSSMPCPPPGWPPPGCPPWYAGPSPPWYPGANAGVSFGQTAPLNPVRGHFWYDGATMWLFDGAGWTAIGGPGSSSNAATGSTPPPNPTPGSLWWNGSVMYIWDGSAWVPQAGTKAYVQPTAPPTPNPGDTWYDGVQLRIWSGTAWALVGPGATVGPVATTTEIFRMVSSDLTLTGTAGSWSIIPFSTTPTVDPQGMWISGTRQMMPKVPGYYQIFIRSYFGGGNTTAGIAAVKNDTGSFGALSQATVAVQLLSFSTPTGAFLSDGGVVKMNGTTDFLRMWALANDNGFHTQGMVPVVEMFLLP